MASILLSFATLEESIFMLFFKFLILFFIFNVILLLLLFFYFLLFKYATRFFYQILPLINSFWSPVVSHVEEN